MVNKSGCKPQKIKNFKQNLKKDENFKSLQKILPRGLIAKYLVFYSTKVAGLNDIIHSSLQSHSRSKPNLPRL